MIASQRTFWLRINLAPFQTCLTNDRSIDQRGNCLDFELGAISRASIYGLRPQAYREIFHNQAIEQIDIGVAQVAQIDVFLDWRDFRLKLLEACGWTLGLRWRRWLC